jgi:PilZ domain
MSARFTLLFICDNPAACSPFYDFLRDAGFRVLDAHSIESTVLCSYVEPVDGVLIYQHDVRLGSIIGCDIKPLFPDRPVVLISTGFETMAPSLDVDAICYSNSLDEETSQVIAMLFRDLVSKPQHPPNDRLEPVYERPGSQRCYALVFAMNEYNAIASLSSAAQIRRSARTEARRCERVAFSMPLRIISHGMAGHKSDQGMCIDISETGVAFVTEADLNFTDVIELVFEANGQTELRCQALLLYRFGPRYGAYFTDYRAVPRLQAFWPRPRACRDLPLDAT